MQNILAFIFRENSTLGSNNLEKALPFLNALMAFENHKNIAVLTGVNQEQNISTIHHSCQIIKNYCNIK